MALPKLQSSETPTDGRPVSQPGTYKNKDTQAVFITAEGEPGTVMADAILTDTWKDVWERVGDVPSSQELLKMRKIQQLKDAKEEAAQKKADEAEIKAAVEGKVKPDAEAIPAPGTGFNVEE